MFESKDVSLVIRENIMNISVLLERSLLKVVVESGSCSDSEIIAYRAFTERMLYTLKEGALDGIYRTHPELAIADFKLHKSEDHHP